MSYTLVCDWMICSRDGVARARLVLERLGLWGESPDQVGLELRDPPSVLVQFRDVNWSIAGVSEFGLVLWACCSGDDKPHDAGRRADGAIFIPFSNVICLHDFTWQLLLNIESSDRADAKKQSLESRVWHDFPDAQAKAGGNGRRTKDQE